MPKILHTDSPKFTDWKPNALALGGKSALVN